MNCLANKETVIELEKQMTHMALTIDDVYQRVYSAFDGRIYATRNDEKLTVDIVAYSWHEGKSFDSVASAAKWLLDEAYKRAKYFEELKKKS